MLSSGRMKHAHRLSRVTTMAVTIMVVTAIAAVGTVERLAEAERSPGSRRGARDAGSFTDVVPDGAWSDAETRSDVSVEDGNDPDSEAFEARRARAASEFALGVAAYRRGDFVAAATHFDNAYQALPAPEPLFNMARAWEGANEIPRAIAAYERYLAEAPQASDRAEVLERIGLLRSRPTQVFISSEPPGARVYLDEDPEPQPSTTPMVVRLPPGPHVVVLEREGSRRAVQRFVARPGEIETLSIVLQPETETTTPMMTAGRVDPRILERRVQSLLSPRLSFLLGAARAWNGLPLALTAGVDAGAFIGRWLSVKVHAERVEPDGVWTLLTGDFGVVYPLEDIDLSLYVTAGGGHGWMSAEDYNRRLPRQWVGLVGAEVRVDWLFHPRLSLGGAFRFVLRNLFVAEVEPLNSFGLSVSLYL